MARRAVGAGNVGHGGPIVEGNWGYPVRTMTHPVAPVWKVACGLALLIGAASGSLTAQARPDALVPALRAGGLVLVMRHASSPREVPTPEQARPDNTTPERQLDEAGRQGATAMGNALRSLRVPLGAIFTSPTYRAVETVRMARFEKPVLVKELGDGGHSMTGITPAMAAWLTKKAAEVPQSGNTLVVTHQPNLSRAFPDWGASVADGETVVLRPDGAGGFAVVGRIAIGEWPTLPVPGR